MISLLEIIKHLYNSKEDNINIESLINKPSQSIYNENNS